MKILVFGAGAIGSVVGGFLARTGHDVFLLGRAPHMAAIRAKGLQITGIWGDYRIKALETFTSSRDLPPETFDLIVFTVKSFDTKTAALQAAPFLAEQSMLLSFQNGLGNAEILEKAVSLDRLLMGRALFGVELTPGVVKVTVAAETIPIGPLPGAKPRRNPVEIAHALSNARIPCRAVSDMLPLVWAKVIYNSALNGPCSVWEIPYGEMLKTKERLSVLRNVTNECYAVAAKCGVRLDPPDTEGYFRVLTEDFIPKTAAHFPSMLADLRKGRRTEIDALNGAVCRLGEQHGVPIPQNQQIYDWVKQLEPAS